MDAIERYELIRPILYDQQTVKEVHQKTGVPLSTLYRYLKRFEVGHWQIESLADKSSAPHNHPLWLTDEQKDLVIDYKHCNPDASARQIARDLAQQGILEISNKSVSTIIKEAQLTPNRALQQQSNETSLPLPVSLPSTQPPLTATNQQVLPLTIDDEPIDIKSERVDDIPLLFKQLDKMEIAPIIDSVINPHKNRCGLSIGYLTAAWLTYIVSQSDHRMSEVESWAAVHRETLKQLLPVEVTTKDFTDDRLADVLRHLSDDDNWQQIEQTLGQRLISVYSLDTDVVRLDSTTISVHHQTEGTELLRLGYSKDYRPDLPQLKAMLATLDPLGLPLATLAVGGNEGDELLYLPAIEQASPIVGTGERLYIGDTKMATLQNRATVAKQGDYYLTVLPMNGKVPQLKEQLLTEFLAGWHPFSIIRKSGAADEDDSNGAIIAIGFEICRTQTTKIDDSSFSFAERVLAVYSPVLAKTARKALRKKLMTAKAELLALTPPRGHGKRQFTDKQALEIKVNEILAKHGVQDLFDVELKEQVETKYVRAYKHRKPRYERRVRYIVEPKFNHHTIKAKRQSMGWRLYVTNAASEKLSLKKVVHLYRGSSSIEYNFQRLKGKSLGIRPVYVQREDHLIGLVRLLSLALRLLSLIEYVVRQRLARLGKSLDGLYAGNPKRTTATPTTERLLNSFNGITLTIIEFADGRRYDLTKLTPLQERILRLLGFSTDTYTQLAQSNCQSMHHEISTSAVTSQTIGTQPP